MIKRVISAVTVVLTALSVFAFPAGAAAKMNIEAKSVSAPATSGTTVKVPISFKNNPGYGFGYVVVQYNNTVLELTDVTYTKLAPAQASAAPIINKGLYKVSYGDLLARENYNGNGEAFTLVFKTTDSAVPGNYKIKLSEPEVYDKDIVEIEAQATSAEVKLTGESKQKQQSSQKTESKSQKTDNKSSQSPEIGKSEKSASNPAAGSGEKAAQQSVFDKQEEKAAENSKLVIAADTAAAELKTGSKIKVPVRFSENTGYAFGSVTAKWDKSVLTLKDVEYTSLAPKQIHENPVENSGSYRVMFGKENTTKNLNGTGTAFTLVFTVNGSAKAGKYSIELSNAEAYTGGLQTVNARAASGIVNIVDKNHKHTLTKIAAVEPECEKEGAEEYYLCTECSMKFSDQDGKNRIYAPKAVKATGHSLKYDESKKLYVCEKCGKTFEDNKAEYKAEKTDSTADSKGGFNPLPVIIICSAAVAAGGAAAVYFVKKKKAKQ